MTKSSYIMLNVLPPKQISCARLLLPLPYIEHIINNQGLKQKCICDPKERKQKKLGID